MKSDSDPTTDDEYVYRRFFYDQLTSDGKVLPGAFKPRVKGRDTDEDGISFYRASCLTSPGQLLEKVDAEKRTKIGVVRIPVWAIRALGLSVESSPDDIPGHVSIPQMNVENYKSNRDAVNKFQEKLASAANDNGEVVVTPSSE